MKNQQKYHPLDQLFSERLSNHESSYSDRIWNNVSSTIINNEEDIAPAFWILFFFATLLATYLMLDLKNNLANNEISLFEQDDESTPALSYDLINYSSLAKEESTMSDIAESNILNSDATSHNLPKDVLENTLHNQSATIPTSPNNEQIAFNLVKSATTEKFTALSKELKSEDLRLTKKVFERPMYNMLAEIHSLEAGGVQMSDEALEAFFKKTTPSDCPVFSGNKPGFAVDLYYSSDYPFSKLSPRNIEDQAYAIARENSESSIYSFSAGLRMSYYWRPNLAIRGGFNYSQINEKFRYEDPDSEQIRTIITIDTVVIGGVTTVTMDTSTIIIKGVAEIQHQNRYKFLDIPLLVGYEIPYQRYNVTLNGGVLFNFAFSQTGRFLNPALEVQDLSASDFNNSLGLSMYASIGLAYRLDDRFSILVEPNVRHFLGSITTTNYPLEQNYTTIGLLTGLRYRF